MRILLAPDSFKGSLSAPDVCDALAEGLRRVLPHASLRALPLADGGEGFSDALMAARGGRWQEVLVVGPLAAEQPRVTTRQSPTGRCTNHHKRASNIYHQLD